MKAENQRKKKNEIRRIVEEIKGEKLRKKK